jgi:hypothetical protein
LRAFAWRLHRKDYLSAAKKDAERLCIYQRFRCRVGGLASSCVQGKTPIDSAYIAEVEKLDRT